MKTAHRLIASLVFQQALSFVEKLWSSPVSLTRHRTTISKAEGDYALYVHIPFCHKPLCRFCCFVRYPYNERLYLEYMKSLRMEAENLLSLAESVRIREVYIGGGTPTVNINGLIEFIDELEAIIGNKPLLSVESSPKDINYDTARLLRSVGVDRLSIGVQSFDKWKMNKIGRLHHTIEDSVKAIEAARGLFPTLNIDMLWGIPGETSRIVRKDAATALDMGVTQITFYPLMSPPRPGSKVSVYIHPLEEEMYKIILNEAFSRNYAPATPWCMTKSTRLIDEYVVDYNDFLAIGVSSIGRLGSYVYLNTFNPKRYIKLVSEKKLGVIRGVVTSKASKVLYEASTVVFGLAYKPGIIFSKSKKNSSLSWRIITEALVSIGISLLGHMPWREEWKVSPRVLYALSLIQKSIYTAVNKLREWGLRTGI